MSPQLAHTIEMESARAGLVADAGMNQDVISRLAEDAVGALAGTYLVAGTDAETQAVAPTTTGEVSDGDGLGVVVYDASKSPAVTAAAITEGSEYDVEQSLPLLGHGRIWVLCDVAATVVANTPCFVRFATLTTAAGVLGAFREDADTADAVALPGAVFRSAHKDVDFGNGFTQRIAQVELNKVGV